MTRLPLAALFFALTCLAAAACATDDDGHASRDASGGGDTAIDTPSNDASTGDQAADPPVLDTVDTTGPPDLGSPDLRPTPQACEPLPLDAEAPQTPIASGDVDALVAAVNSAEPGETILLADGTYALGGAYLWIDTPGVSLRGQSGDREAVIIDGEYETGQVVSIVTSNVTIADLTIRRAYNHAIHVQSGESATHEGTLVYNVAVIDPGQQGIKVNESGDGPHPDAGIIACSHIELTNAGRPNIRDNCYTGGIDIHGSLGWHIRDNAVAGFWCDTGLSEHGIHFWQYNANALIERNVVINCARGIGLGLSSSGTPTRAYPQYDCPDAFVDDWGGTIRNNVVFADDPNLFASQSGFDGGISLASACEATVVHNTVYSTQPPFASIEYRFPGTTAYLANNLVSHDMRERDAAVAELAGNIAEAGADHFVDAAASDLHLASGSDAIGAGQVLASGLCDEDIDGDPRGNPPDVGADER